MATLGLVACSKSKAHSPQRAETLYQGALFRKSLMLAKKQCDSVAILSALYGLLPLDQVIAPYEKTLHAMTVRERIEWDERVAAQIVKEYGKGWNYIYYAGEIYCSNLPYGKRPMRGLTIGKRLQWLDQQMQGKGLI